MSGGAASSVRPSTAIEEDATITFLQTASGGDPFGQLVDLGVAGVVIGAMFVAIRLMWSRLEAVTDRFLEHLEEKERDTASALQSVVDTLQRLEGAMAEHERRAVERHEQQLARAPRERV